MRFFKRIFYLLIVHLKSEPKTWLEIKIRENIRLDKIRREKHRRMIGVIENKALMTKAIKGEL